MVIWGLNWTKPKCKNGWRLVTWSLWSRDFSWDVLFSWFCTNSLYIRLSLDIFSLFLETWSLEPAYAMEEINQSQISKTSTLPSFDSPLFSRQELLLIITNYSFLRDFLIFSKFFKIPNFRLDFFLEIYLCHEQIKKTRIFYRNRRRTAYFFMFLWSRPGSVQRFLIMSLKLSISNIVFCSAHGLLDGMVLGSVCSRTTGAFRLISYRL